MENNAKGYIVGVRYCLENRQYHLRDCKCYYKSG